MKALCRVVVFALFVVTSAWADSSDSLLKGLKGVGLRIHPVNLSSSGGFPFDGAAFKEEVVQQLNARHIRLFSDEEIAVIPGRPFLAVSLDIKHAQGPSHMYLMKVSLLEMAQLDRPKDRIVSMAVPTWERESMGVVNRPEALFEVVERLLRILGEEWHKANASETP